MCLAGRSLPSPGGGGQLAGSGDPARDTKLEPISKKFSPNLFLFDSHRESPKKSFKIRKNVSSKIFQLLQHVQWPSWGGLDAVWALRAGRDGHESRLATP